MMLEAAEGNAHDLPKELTNDILNDDLDGDVNDNASKGTAPTPKDVKKRERFLMTGKLIFMFIAGSSGLFALKSSKINS